MESVPKELYRQGIVAVIVNESGLLCMGQRSDDSRSWQFPQGGIEPGESPRDAFFREVREELGTDQVELLKVGANKTIYRWPEPGRDRLGQEQTWFLARFTNGAEPNLENSDQCFCAWKWAKPEVALAEIIEWKRAAFEEGLRMLGLVDGEKQQH